MDGMVKTVIKCGNHGIYFILLYWNDELSVNRYKHWNYIRDLVNKNKRIVVMCDANK